MQFIKDTRSKIDSIFGLYRDEIRRFPYLLTPSEELFFKCLLGLLENEDYYICPKVRLGDIIKLPDTHWHNNSRLSGRPWKIEHRIDRSHIDFLLISKKNSHIQFAIELDDPSHNNPETQEHDEVKNEALRLAGVSIKRFSSHFITRDQLVEQGIL